MTEIQDKDIMELTTRVETVGKQIEKLREVRNWDDPLAGLDGLLHESMLVALENQKKIFEIALEILGNFEKALADAKKTNDDNGKKQMKAPTGTEFPPVHDVDEGVEK